MQKRKSAGSSNRMFARSCELATLLLITELLVSINAIATDQTHLEPVIEFDDEFTSLQPVLSPFESRSEASDSLGDPFAEAEAYFEVESLLATMSLETEGELSDQFLEVSVEQMQNMLVEQTEVAEAAESSSTGETRGHLRQLIRKLVLMYDEAKLCQLDDLSANSEAIGNRLIQIEGLFDSQLEHLNKYLAGLHCASETCTTDGPPCWVDDEALTEDEEKRRRKKKTQKEKSWFEKALELIGL